MVNIKAVAGALSLGGIFAWFQLYSEIKAFQRQLTALQWGINILEWIQHPPSLQEIITAAITAASPIALKLGIILVAIVILYYLCEYIIGPILEFIWYKFLEPIWCNYLEPIWVTLCVYILDPIVDLVIKIIFFPVFAIIYIVDELC